MLKLEKNQYQNSIFQLNYTRYEKKLAYKITFYIKIYKFELQHFFSTEIFSNYLNIKKIIFKEFENLSVKKKTLSTALGFEHRYFDCRSNALTTECQTHLINLKK